MLGFIPIVGPLLETAGKIFGAWQERKKIKAEGAIEIEKAKVSGAIQHAQSMLEGEMKYDQTAAEGMQFSWKDEWLTLLLSAPFIMCFIPPLQDAVAKGFEVLKNNTPEWYQYCFIGVIVASFGLRSWLGRKNM